MLKHMKPPSSKEARLFLYKAPIQQVLEHVCCGHFTDFG